MGWGGGGGWADLHLEGQEDGIAIKGAQSKVKCVCVCGGGGGGAWTQAPQSYATVAILPAP